MKKEIISTANANNLIERLNFIYDAARELDFYVIQFKIEAPADGSLFKFNVSTVISDEKKEG